MTRRKQIEFLLAECTEEQNFPGQRIMLKAILELYRERDGQKTFNRNIQDNMDTAFNQIWKLKDEVKK